MRGKSTADEIAARQHGVVSRAQLLDAGHDRCRIDRDVAARRLHRIHAGVYAVGHRALSDRGRWLAAVLAGGPHAVLSHRSAGALHGLPVSDNGLTHITAPTKHDRRLVDCHQAALLRRDWIVRDRIRVTSIARTLADLAHVLDDESLHRVVREAQFRGVWRDGQVADVLTRRPSRRLRGYLGDATLTQSKLEDRFLRLCRRHGLPIPVCQYGTKPRVDFIWHDARVIVEVDGWQAHGTRVAFQQDRSVTNALLLAGFLVLRFTHDDVTRRPGLVAAQVRQALGR
jgi:very-short-patch-repair endonuclease